MTSARVRNSAARGTKPAERPASARASGAVGRVQLKRDASVPGSTGIRAPLALTDEQVEAGVRTPGEPLTPEARNSMERRFGYDFSHVRVHTESSAQQVAAALGARAFTTGADVVFGRGQYTANTPGSWLLAHELAHVVQQGAASPLQTSRHARPPQPLGTERSGAAGVLQRAELQIGALTIHIDYGDLIAIDAQTIVSEIEGRINAYTGAPPSPPIHASIVALTFSQQGWVLHGLDLLQENTTLPRDAALNRAQTVERLIEHAPAAVHSFTLAHFDAAREALRESGWLEVALAGQLAVPDSAVQAQVQQELNPPAASGRLRIGMFRRRLARGVRRFLEARDPANWPSVGSDSLPTLQGIGDMVLEEAKTFFSPLPAAARGSVFGSSTSFHISPNIFNVNTLTVRARERVGYLTNRATIVGRNTTPQPELPDTHIFSETRFDSANPRHQWVFNDVVRSLAADRRLEARIDRLIRHTGRQQGSGPAATIGIDLEFDSTANTACEARWKSVGTLCHEVLHALTHPDFRAAADAQGFGQAMVEGFTEVLSVQLFNDGVKTRAARDPTFKDALEAGLSDACAPPPDRERRYAEAGAAAERILSLVGSERFRAAYFLGQTRLLGL